MTGRGEAAGGQPASAPLQRRPSTLSGTMSNLAGSPRHTNILKVGVLDTGC